MDNQFVHLTKSTCERVQYSSWSWRLLRQRAMTDGRKSKLRQHARRLSIALGSKLHQGSKHLMSAAFRGVEAFLGARKVNSNFYCGLILMVVGITGAWGRLFFDAGENFPVSAEIKELCQKGLPLPDGVWYYTNWHYFFVGLGPHFLTFFAFCAGVLWTERHVVKLLYLVPIGFEVANIPWLITARCDADFNAVPNYHFFITAFLFILVVVLSFRFWMDRKYHKYDGICARIQGLLKAPGIDAETKARLFDQLAAELKAFH